MKRKTQKSVFSVLLTNPQEIILIGEKKKRVTVLYLDLYILQEYCFGLLAYKYDMNFQK